MTIKLNKYLAISLTALLVGTLLAAVVTIPQQASAIPSVTLPTGADGQDTDEELLVYACPTGLHVYAPMPLETVANGGYSSRQPLESEGFRWEIEIQAPFSRDQVLNYFDNNYAAVFPIDGASIGHVVDFDLEGIIGISHSSNSLTTSATVVDPTYSLGSGTKADPYLVSNAAELSKMRCHMNKHFKLTNDITLTGKWLPILGLDNEGDDYWEGGLDGNGKSISGLNVGSPTMRLAGLFGKVRNSYFSDLTLTDPLVVGRSEVGSLAGLAERGTSITGLTVTGAEVHGTQRTGLLLGKMEYGTSISETSVQGSIIANPEVRPLTNSTETVLVVESINNIGGMVGTDSGKGTAHLNNKVDVEISIFPEVNFMELARQEATFTAVRDQGTINKIGGYVGDLDDQGPTYRFLDVTSKIVIEALGRESDRGSAVQEIGGFAGESDTTVSGLNVQSDIKIVQLGTYSINGSGVGAIRRVGGVIGDAENSTASFANVESNISIERADGENNLLEITSTETMNVSEVGGIGGYYDEETFDAYNRVNTNINVVGAGAISYVAGFVGRYSDSSLGLGNSDNFVSGSIELDASSSISKVGGFVNVSDDGNLSGRRSFVAMQITLDGEATVDANTVGPFVGDLNTDAEAPERAIARHTIRDSFWDSTLNSDSTPTVDGVSAASTTELKSSAFLKELGMDLDNVWILNGGYPELRPAVYTFGFARSGSTVTTGPSFFAPVQAAILVPTAVKMVTKAAVADVVVVRGVNLNSITEVRVGNRKVAYTVRPNGNVTFKVPNLAKGKYKVTISGQGQASSITKNLRVTSR